MRGNTVTIEVSLKRGKMAKSVPLYQYDYGQKLIFTNVELPDVYEVHFSNEMYGRAVTMIGDSTGVFIPDEMLASGSPVYLWLFLHDGADDGETEYTGVIPIIQRAKPDDEEPTPEQQSVITQAIAALNNGVEIVESIAGDVSGALAAALEEAKESGEFDGADGRDGVDGQDGADGYTPQKGIDYDDGADGFSPVVSISTIDGGHRMTVEDAQGTQSVDIMDGAKGDKGDTGSVENVFASTVPMSPDDDTTILNAMGDKISKLTNATSGNFASFDANGGIEDSGHSHSDYLTQHQDISGKLDVTDFFATEMPMSDQDATTVSSAISSNSTAIAKVQNGLAYIVGNTNTTGGTIAVGQFVYVKGHSTITEGLRTVTASISANGNITTSNTSACSDGGLNAINSKFTTLVTSGSLHDLAGQTGLFWLTSTVTDKPTQSGGLLILRSYDATYCVGEYIDVDSGNVHSIALIGTTWAARRFNFYTGMKSITKVDGTYTSGSSGNIALGTSASTGKKVVIGAICTSMDAYVRIWYATNNEGWYATIVNPNTGATINNTQVTLTYWVIDTD